ncbi:KH domain protein, partial [Chlamydia psittaci 84-8471/1]
MKDFLSYIIKNLVDRPEEVHIKEVQGTHTIIYELTVAKPDIGKIIGK